MDELIQNIKNLAEVYSANLKGKIEARTEEMKISGHGTCRVIVKEASAAPSGEDGGVGKEGKKERRERKGDWIDKPDPEAWLKTT